MMRWRNHLFAVPVGTSAVGTSAVGTWVADRRVADMPAVAEGSLVAVDFEDHLVQRHN